MKYKDNFYDSKNPIDDSPNKKKLPLEESVSTLVNVFFRRFLAILIAATTVVFFSVIVWLTADYAQFVSAILIGIAGSIVLLFFFSLFRRRATPFDKSLKRLFDILSSLVNLVLLSPILLFIAIIIKLDSQGPIFFLQERLGKDGKVFKLIRFRTMVINTGEDFEKLLERSPHLRKEWDKKMLLKADPRVTRVGKFLRKTSLDEIPQIINILRGEMSFVGPRPLLISHIELFGEEYLKTYEKIRPGITGLWQVSSRKEMGFEDRIKLDEYYVNQWVLWMDIKIMVETVAIVLHSQGAY